MKHPKKQPARDASVLRVRLYAEIEAERLRQDEKWGEQNYPSVDPVLTGRPGGATAQRMAEEYEMPTAGRAKQLCDINAHRGELTFTHVALEEFAEVVEAATEGGDGLAREELVQTAAVLIAWIEAIDRRGAGGAR